MAPQAQVREDYRQVDSVVQRAMPSMQEGATEFLVSMPNLIQCRPELDGFPDPVKMALHFITAVDLPEPGCAPGEQSLLEEVGLGPIPKGGSDKLTLVLDLDETLVHCRPERIEGVLHDFTVSFEETRSTGYIYVRPFARLFLDIVSRLCEVVVFTASSHSYADQVLDTLDPDGKCVNARLYRQHCTEVAGGFVKDVQRLGRPMDKVVLVDNSPVSLAMSPDNGVICSCWTGDRPGDRELVDLLLLLQQCMMHPSVTDFLAMRYGLREFVNELRHRPDLIRAGS